jgi:hypothetical protein
MYIRNEFYSKSQVGRKCNIITSPQQPRYNLEVLLLLLLLLLWKQGLLQSCRADDDDDDDDY